MANPNDEFKLPEERSTIIKTNGELCSPLLTPDNQPSNNSENNNFENLIDNSKDITKLETDRLTCVAQCEIKTKTFISPADSGEAENNVYNPFHHRNVESPTNNCEALIHMLKASLGAGILAIPSAFKNGGLWFSLFATIIVGVIVTYCTHVFVKCGQILCRRRKIPLVTFKQVAELSFLEGPSFLKRYSKFVGILVDTSLVTEMLGCCCAFLILSMQNLKQVSEHYFGHNWDLRFYMVMAAPILICFSLIRNFKQLALISMTSNALFIGGITVTYYYIFSDLPPTSERPAFTSLDRMPSFFGTMIFALEGIGVVIPLENNMKNPHNFLGCPGVLNVGMSLIISLYVITGFFGYLKYGTDTKANIILNLPIDKLLGQILKLLVGVGVFFSYSLPLFLAAGIIFNDTNNRNPESSRFRFYTRRILLIILTVIIAVLFPNLGPLLTLLGALTLSMVGLILPPIFETLIYSKSPGMGFCYWRLWKNVLIFLFGIIGLISGTTVALKEMYENFDTIKD